jgi:hypothetical protein
LPGQTGALTRQRDLSTRPDRHEVVVGNGVLIFLSKEFLLDQHVESGRQRARILAAEKRDRPRILLTAKDELCFLLALSGLLPYRKRRSHHDRHHAERHQQGGHRVSVLIP